MGLNLNKLHPDFAVEIDGVDLTRPLDDATFAEIRNLFDEYSLLVFHDQPFTDDSQIAFSQRFGPLEDVTSTLANTGIRTKIAKLSNVDADGRLVPPAGKQAIYNSGNMLWHSDSSFKETPALASMLSGREVPPEGGETEFASLRAAYDRLSEAEKDQLEGLVAEHDFSYSRGLVAADLVSPEQQMLLPPVPQRVVRINPANGRKNLYLGSHASHVLDWPVAEGRALLGQILEAVSAPEYTYCHRWRQYDLVIWDNRCMVHRGRAWDGHKFRRVMHRTTVAGAGSSFQAG